MMISTNSSRANHILEHVEEVEEESVGNEEWTLVARSMKWLCLG
jgi:hypothetical protein